MKPRIYLIYAIRRILSAMFTHFISPVIVYNACNFCDEYHQAWTLCYD